jgi:acetolactate synthase-1/2/3 large subunit
MSGPVADAKRIAAATGADVIAAGSNGRIERGRGRHPLNRIPYPVDQAVALMKDYANVILVGTAKPVIFFAYPNKPGSPVPPNANAARADPPRARPGPGARRAGRRAWQPARRPGADRRQGRGSARGKITTEVLRRQRSPR